MLLIADPSSSISTANQAAVALQRLSIDRDGPFKSLELPREIRDEIYNFCFLTEYKIVMHLKEYEFSDVPAFKVDDHSCVALLQLNKEIYSETFPGYLLSVSTYRALYLNEIDNEDSEAGFEFEEDYEKAVPSVPSRGAPWNEIQRSIQTAFSHQLCSPDSVGELGPTTNGWLTQAIYV